MTNNRKLTIFILIAFLLPLLLVIVQSRLSNAGISFVLFGIQAASPTISAAIVLGLNKELHSTVAGELRQKNLIKSVAYPLIITCMTMVLSKAIYCFCFGSEFEICQLSVTQFFVVMWALIAEEFGWRGFLEPLLGKMGVHRLLTPCIVGIIWPYVILTILEGMIASYIIVRAGKRNI